MSGVDKHMTVRERAVDLISGTPLEWPARNALRTAHRLVPNILLSRTGRQGRDYDRLTIEIARRTLRSDSDSVDAGAHIGELLTEFVSLAPYGRHLAIEPIPRFARRLEQKFPDVLVVNAALGAQKGTTRFVVAKDAARSHVVGSGASAVDGETCIEVSVVTLDSLVPADRDVRLIKIDVEGAERDVVRGARQLLARCAPVVTFECASGNLDAVMTAFDDVPHRDYQVNFLRAHVDGVEPRRRSEVIELAQRVGEYYFVATPSRPVQ